MFCGHSTVSLLLRLLRNCNGQADPQHVKLHVLPTGSGCTMCSHTKSSKAPMQAADLPVYEHALTAMLFRTARLSLGTSAEHGYVPSAI